MAFSYIVWIVCVKGVQRNGPKRTDLKPSELRKSFKNFRTCSKIMSNYRITFSAENIDINAQGHDFPRRLIFRKISNFIYQVIQS